MFMRNVWERGNELATVLISRYLRDLHWCTTHLRTKVQLFYERTKRRCIFHYCRIIFYWVYHQSTIYEFPDSVIRPFPLLVCESSTIALESWKVERQAVSVGIFLLWRVFSQKTFPLSMSVLRNADGNGNERLTKMQIKINWISQDLIWQLRIKRVDL